MGEEIRLDGQLYTVVGVAPEGVGSRLVPALQVDVWAPVGITGAAAGLGAPTVEDLNRRGNRGFFAMGRLRKGVTPARGQSQLAMAARRLHAEYPQA